MRSRLTLAAALILAAGCSKDVGPKVVQVSGRVTLDGQPLAKARVEFQPIGSTDNPNPGAGSFGITDADGRYTLTLMASPPRPGAVVATHRVVIRAKPPAGATDEASTGKAPGEPVPAKYNTDSALKFPVPSGGTDKADFELKTKG